MAASGGARPKCLLSHKSQVIGVRQLSSVCRLHGGKLHLPELLVDSLDKQPRYVKAAGVLQGNDLYREMIESGVIKTGEHAGESKCTLVYGQMNEPPGARARVALTGPSGAHCSAVMATTLLVLPGLVIAGKPGCLSQESPISLH